MAVTVGTLASAEITAMGAGTPFFVGSNALRDRNAAAVWSLSGEWSDSAPAGLNNCDDAAYPTRYLHDDVLYNVTRPSSAAVGRTSVYLLLDLDDAAGHIIDTVWLYLNNGPSLAGDVTIKLEVDDDLDFPAASILSAWSGNGVGKLIDVRLGATYVSPSSYGGVRYARLKIETSVGTGFTSGNLPEIGELVLGRRRCLARKPRLPWDPEAEESAVDWFEADTTGIVGGDVRWTRRGRWTLNLRPSSTTHAGIDETANLRSLHEDTDGFTRPFLWVDEPTISGETTGITFDAHGNGHFVYTPNPASIMPYLAAYQSAREAVLELVELPPFQSSEVAA
jgi:hypothetical protein